MELLFVISFNRLFAFVSAVGFISFGFYFFKYKQAKIYNLPLLIGVALFLINTIGPLGKSDKVLRKIISSQNQGVKSVMISNLNSRRVNKNILEKEFILYDSSLINKITSVLSFSTAPWFPDYDPPYEWGVNMELRFDDGSAIPFMFYKWKSKGIIDVYSGGNSGWNYGELICDDLIGVLENIILNSPNTAAPPSG